MLSFQKGKDEPSRCVTYSLGQGDELPIQPWDHYTAQEQQHTSSPSTNKGIVCCANDKQANINNSVQLNIPVFQTTEQQTSLSQSERLVSRVNPSVVSVLQSEETWTHAQLGSSFAPSSLPENQTCLTSSSNTRGAIQTSFTCKDSKGVSNRHCAPQTGSNVVTCNPALRDRADTGLQAVHQILQTNQETTCIPATQSRDNSISEKTLHNATDPRLCQNHESVKGDRSQATWESLDVQQ